MGLDVTMILVLDKAVVHCNFTSGCTAWSLGGSLLLSEPVLNLPLSVDRKMSDCLRFISWFVTLHPLTPTQQQQQTIVGEALQVNGTSVLIKTHLERS